MLCERGLVFLQTDNFVWAGGQAGKGKNGTSFLSKGKIAFIGQDQGQTFKIR